MDADMQLTRRGVPGIRVAVINRTPMEKANGRRLSKADQAKLLLALNSQNLQGIKAFLARGWNPLDTVNGDNPLSYADSPPLAKCLIDAGADLDGGKHGWTPILARCDDGNEDMVALLIKSGAEVNRPYSKKGCPQIPFGTTPLMKAAGHGHLGIVKRLISAGADINYVDEHRHNALFRALYWNRVDVAKELLKRGSQLTEDALGGPVHHGNTGLVRLLIAKKAEVNCVLRGFEDRGLFQDGETLLGCAVSRIGLQGFPIQIVQILIRAGANVNQPSRWQGSLVPPLVIAVGRGDLKVIEVIRRAGALMSVQEALEKSGWTLEKACFRGEKGVVKLFIQAGLELDGRGYEGKQPIELARLKGHNEIVRMLRGAGVTT